jgi:hypothetical protein
MTYEWYAKYLHAYVKQKIRKKIFKKSLAMSRRYGKVSPCHSSTLETLKHARAKKKVSSPMACTLHPQICLASMFAKTQAKVVLPPV